MYDLMQPLRPWVDCSLLGFVLSRIFAPSDFVLGSNGICRLHPQLAREATTMLPLDNAVIWEVVGWLVEELRAIVDRRSLEHKYDLLRDARRTG